MLSALLCLVVSVSDGQTLQVRCPNAQPEALTVQVHGIAAPHPRQAYGPQARQALAQLCHLQQARVQFQTNHQSTDRSARVTCRELDVASQLVTQGLAWADPHVTMPRTDLERLERDARTRHRGLWGDLDPVAPWIWQPR